MTKYEMQHTHLLEFIKADSQLESNAYYYKKRLAHEDDIATLITN